MYSSKGRSKNVAVLVLIMLTGVVIGSYVGEMLVNVGSAVEAVSFLKTLGYYHLFGITQPFTLDLVALSITFGITVKFSICSVVFMFLSIFIYRQL